MGRTKELFMEMSERGWSSIHGEKSVCGDCVGDSALKECVRRNSSLDECSYCGKTGTGIAADADEVLQAIGEGVNFEWEDPVHGVGYCSQEGGYLLPLTDIWDILASTGLSEGNQEFFEDVLGAFERTEWVHHDPYGDRECDALFYTWKEFSDQVIRSCRFTFFRARTTDECREPFRILAEIERIAGELGLIREIPIETKLARARLHPASEHLSTAAEMGPPPAQFAPNNRMSPKGIPMLYMTREAATAHAEILTGAISGQAITTATFAVKRPLRVLDLSRIPDVPSLFDTNKRHERMPILFLHAFADEIAKPVDREADGVEYVPTQVLTEYFRHVYRDETGKSIDGIAYRSSRHPGGECFTFFVEGDTCSDATWESSFSMVAIDRSELIVAAMDGGSES